jgi:ABC-type multidrug transport system fused ATPase/permease subunit
MTLQNLGVYLLVMIRLGPQVLIMNNQWSNMQACMASYRNLRAQIGEAERHREAMDAKYQFARLEHALEFQDVSFSYTGDVAQTAILREVSCQFAKRTTTAIVGRSGAGKTTLVLLLASFYTPQRGQVRIDGEPISQFSRASLRRHMALVPQEPFLFNDTIRNNLCFGLDPPVSERSIRQALAVSHCIEFVDQLAEGLDTRVGSRGGHLSQGQRQRLTIAHALLTEPHVLILDEPTSALDSESEQAIQDTLERLKGRLTMVIIAHRLQTIRHADKIILLDRGRIAAEGEHQHLLEVSHLYRSLFDYAPAP